MREIGNYRTLGAHGGALCLLAGLLAGSLGFALTAGLWVMGANLHPFLRSTDTVLFVIAIPLILLAGCWLDWSEKRR